VTKEASEDAVVDGEILLGLQPSQQGAYDFMVMILLI